MEYAEPYHLHQFGVVYEMNLDLVTYRRAVYNLLEWVSQIGGLSSALISGYLIVFKVLMYKAIEFHLVERVYKRSELKELVGEK